MAGLLNHRVRYFAMDIVLDVNYLYTIVYKSGLH